MMALGIKLSPSYFIVNNEHSTTKINVLQETV